MFGLVLFLVVLSTINNYNIRNEKLLKDIELQTQKVKQLKSEQENLIKEKDKLNLDLQEKQKMIEEKEKALQAKATRTVVNKNLTTEKVEIYRPLVARFFPENQIENALKIMTCECKSGNPVTVNDNPATGDYSVGLFQINLYGNLAKARPSEEWLKSAENNIQYASQVFSKQGWHPWSCKKVLI